MACQNFKPVLKQNSIIFFLTVSYLILVVYGQKLGNRNTLVNIEVVPNIYVKTQQAHPWQIVVRDLAKEVVITCHASCPMKWTLEKYRYGTFPSELKGAIKFHSRREFTDFWNVSSYRYISTMFLEGSTNKLTGNYICACVDREHEGQASIYIYWEGSSGSYLLQAGEYRKVYQEPGSQYFRMYCGLSKPNVPVYLFHGEKALRPDDRNVIQDIDGFLVNSKLVTGEDDFVCSLKDTYHSSIDDFLEIARFEPVDNATQKEKIILHKFSSLTQDSKNFVHYDTSKNNLICCSNVGHRQVGYYCQNPSACGFFSNRLISGDNAEDRNRTCSWYTEGFEGDDGAVVFRCDNRVDFEVEAEKFYGLDAKSYLSIEDATREKWNFIKLQYNTTRAQRLQRSTIRFECKHSTYLFSEGFVWLLIYANGSQVLINNPTKNLANRDFEIEKIWNDNGNFEWIELRIYNEKIKQLSCLGPLWNSNEWWNSTVDLFVEESFPPRFEDPKHKEIYSEEGNKLKLKCEAVGYPKPNLVWRKDGKIIPETSGVAEIVENNQTESSSIQPIRVQSILEVTVAHNNTGNYICMAKSDVGETSKTFVVQIRDDSTIIKIIGITAGVIILLLLILGFSLRKIIQQRKAIQFLTNKEIEEFEKGNPEALAKLNSTNEYTNNAHHLLPYNTDYEVPKDNLFVDYGIILGQGTYGMVLKGKLKRRGEEFDVAVKTIKPNEDCSHFKVLLCEVKIMAYIGSHKNIICLVGAFTRNIRNRELLVATEFCENGNLLETLRNARKQFFDSYEMKFYNEDGDDFPGYANQKYNISTIELLKWSADIASGMEFLGVKRVIHGDLACRNILLGRDNTAKVGDFGLSKHLFQYSTYQKKTVQLLPWRWLALESLTDMMFSLQSDVWAFGVTLWEIFSLAQTPYPGMNWDDVFIKRLEDDYRLQKPQFASKQIYELILSCWVRNPAKRPNFTVLKQCIHELLEILTGGSYTSLKTCS